MRTSVGFVAAMGIVAAISAPSLAETSRVIYAGAPSTTQNGVPVGTHITVAMDYDESLQQSSTHSSTSSTWSGNSRSSIIIGPSTYSFDRLEIVEDRRYFDPNHVYVNIRGYSANSTQASWQLALESASSSQASSISIPTIAELSHFSATEFIYFENSASYVRTGSLTSVSPYEIYAGHARSEAFGPIIAAEFRPAYGLTLNDAAHILGYDNFNWQQTVVAADPAALPFLLLASQTPPPFFDPIPRGYSYNRGLEAYPFYYDNNNSFAENGYNLSGHISQGGTLLGFADEPTVPCFADPSACYTYFKTDLVGVRNGSVADKLYEFAWKSNFSAINADGKVLKLNGADIDPASGVGGVTLISEQYFAPGVPEPSTWLTMLAGFGMIGFTIRRQRMRLSYS